MARKHAVARLPAEVKTYIESLLAQGQLTLDEMLADIRARFPQEQQAGQLPSRSSLQRYGVKLERRLVAVKAFTEAAQAIDAHAQDKGDTRSAALTAIVQQELFDAMINLQDASDPEADQAERIAMLSAAAKNIATLARASANTKQHQAKVEADARKALIAEQAAALAAMPNKGGVTEDTKQAIRQALGIT